MLLTLPVYANESSVSVSQNISVSASSGNTYTSEDSSSHIFIETSVNGEIIQQIDRIIPISDIKEKESVSFSTRSEIYEDTIDQKQQELRGLINELRIYVATHF